MLRALTSPATLAAMTTVHTPHMLSRIPVFAVTTSPGHGHTNARRLPNPQHFMHVPLDVSPCSRTPHAMRACHAMRPSSRAHPTDPYRRQSAPSRPPQPLPTCTPPPRPSPSAEQPFAPWPGAPTGHRRAFLFPTGAIPRPLTFVSLHAGDGPTHAFRPAAPLEENKLGTPRGGCATQYYPVTDPGITLEINFQLHPKDTGGAATLRHSGPRPGGGAVAPPRRTTPVRPCGAPHEARPRRESPR